MRVAKDREGIHRGSECSGSGFPDLRRFHTSGRNPGCLLGAKRSLRRQEGFLVFWRVDGNLALCPFFVGARLTPFLLMALRASDDLEPSYRMNTSNSSTRTMGRTCIVWQLNTSHTRSRLPCVPPISCTIFESYRLRWLR